MAAELRVHPLTLALEHVWEPHSARNSSFSAATRRLDARNTTSISRSPTRVSLENEEFRNESRFAKHALSANGVFSSAKSRLADSKPRYLSSSDSSRDPKTRVFDSGTRVSGRALRKKAVVTGAAGALGSHMAERLVKEGYEVIGIDAFTTYYDPSVKHRVSEEIQKSGVRFVQADLVQDDVSDILRDAEVIVHFAGQPGISSSTTFEEYLRNNVVATEHLLRAAEQASSVRAFINIGTSSIYGRVADGDESSEPKPTSHYGVTKLAAEQLVLARVRDQGFPGLSLRIFSVYGERERPNKFFRTLIEAIARDKEVPLHEGARDHVRSFSYVGDIIDGCMLAIAKAPDIYGEIFNLGSEKTRTTGEAIDIIERQMGKKARFVMKPPRSGEQLETAANIEKATRVLGWQPKSTLEEGLAREVAWYLSQIA